MKKLIFASVIASFMFIGVNVFAGTPTMPPISLICCEYQSISNSDEFQCGTFNQQSGCPGPNSGFVFLAEFSGDICNDATGRCELPARNVPTMSEWGLIAMAGVLGIIGYMILRRRKATA